MERPNFDKHQKHILDTLIKLKVTFDVDAPYDTIINNLPDAIIATLFKLTWNACCPNKFCRYHNLNKGNFSSYLANKKTIQ